MLKKGAIGLFFAVAGFFAWSCGDGSVDSLTDTEMMMISRFPSTINYDMLDSIVKACEKDKECWEKAKKTGEIYKGDYTTILRDSSGNIIYQEGDSAFIYDKDGKKLPVFVLSSNSASGGEEDVTTSGSTATSGSSSKRSSASGAGYDDDFVDDYTGNSNGSGSGTSSRQYASTSSSSRNTGNSSSIDLSVLNASSSSVKVASSTSINIDVGSSSSKIVITQSSVSQSSSSKVVVVLSSSSTAQHGGGGGGGETGTTCTTSQLKGVCKPTKDEVVKGKPVTYKFTPANGNTCNATDNIQWSVLPGLDGTTGGASPTDQVGGYTFDVTYSLAGEKKSVMFTMGGVNVPCDAVTIKADCNTANSYSCTVKLNSASNNLTKNNPVSYTWTLTKGGCNEVTSIAWSGAVAGSSASVTKTFNSAGSYSASVKVMDEGRSSASSVTCAAAEVRNVTETKPSFNVADIPVAVVGASLTVTPTSVVGCDYDSDKKCSYTLKKSSGSPSVSGTLYQSGALKPISGESTDGTVGYTLTMTNYLNEPTTKTFNVTYVTPVDTTATTTFISYAAGAVYRVSVGTISNGNNKFKCNVGGQASVNRVVGVFDGTTLTIDSWQTRTNTVEVTSNSSHVFIVSSDRPSDMTCGLLNW